MSGEKTFMDTNVLLYLLSSDAATENADDLVRYNRFFGFGSFFLYC